MIRRDLDCVSKQLGLAEVDSRMSKMDSEWKVHPQMKGRRQRSGCTGDEGPGCLCGRVPENDG